MADLIIPEWLLDILYDYELPEEHDDTEEE